MTGNWRDEMRAAERAMGAAMSEINSLVSGSREQFSALRAEWDAQREERDREAEHEAAMARRGELGRARQVLQQRLDQDETTWAAVLGDDDDHWSAQEYRKDLVQEMRDTIDDLEEQDPEFSDEYRSVAEGRDPHEGPGEWASLGTPDVKNHPGSGQGPRDQGGQW